MQYPISSNSNNYKLNCRQQPEQMATQPIIYLFNIRQSVYRNFGLNFHKHAQTLFNMHLLPIVTINSDTIQRRALKISKLLPEFMDRNGIKQAHIACYSTSGVDFRFAISELGMAKYVRSLTTISSPHLGSKLALLSDRKFFPDATIDPISRLTGVGLKAFHQFVPENMKNFNKFVKDVKDVEYYSVGSQCLPSLCANSLADTGKYLTLKTQANFQYHNDGVFGHDEIQWGNHITNFQVDHGQVAGIYGLKNCLSFKLVKQIADSWGEKTKENRKDNEKAQGKIEAKA